MSSDENDNLRRNKHLLVLQDVRGDKKYEKLILRQFDWQGGAHQRVVLVGAWNKAARQLLKC